jgi:hypothetical protein
MVRVHNGARSGCKVFVICQTLLYVIIWNCGFVSVPVTCVEVLPFCVYIAVKGTQASFCVTHCGLLVRRCCIYLSVRLSILSCFAATGIFDKHLSLVGTCHVFGTVCFLQILAVCPFFVPIVGKCDLRQTNRLRLVSYETVFGLFSFVPTIRL